MGARRAWLVGGIVLLAVLPAPARADEAATTEELAATATARVTRLTADYRRHSAAAAATASELAAAYARIATADDAAATSAAGATRARSERAASTLTLYADGVGARAELALLTARTPEDALWRAAVGVRIGERVLTEATRRDATAGAAAAADGVRAKAAYDATIGLAQVLGRLHGEEVAAGLALEEARAELNRLDAAARQERAARQAAADLALATGAATAARLDSNGPVTALGVPEEFERAYRDAARTCPGMDWTLLAAVGQIESGHGRNNGPSSAGAVGPMQFMPGTFAAYGVDGDGDGAKDPWDPQDAVFSAARYLCVNGAGQGSAGTQRALLAYNHAQWYVDLVLAARAAILARHPS